MPATPPSNNSDGLHRLLVSSVRDYAIFALDPSGHVLSWNEGAQRIKGYAAEEIIGRHFSTFYPPEAVATGFPQHELEVAASVGRFEDEGWRVRKDGSLFWANVVITALRDERGELVGFAKVTRDLTDRKAAEDELRRSEERFRLLVESVKDYAIFMLDPEGRVASWNEGAQRIKGYAAQEILGKSLSVFYPEEAAATGFPQHELDVAAREGRFEDEGWRLRTDGSRFWANVVLTAIRDKKSGRLLVYTKVTRDLTARREAEEQARRLAAEEAARETAEKRRDELERLTSQLQEQAVELETQTEEAQSLTEDLELSNEELQSALRDAEEARDAAHRAAVAAAEAAEMAAAANRAKTDFLAVMSHELRTPLNAIGGYAQLLEMGIRGPVTPEQQQDIARIRRSQQHLLAIINDILNYSRVEAGQVAYDMGPVPLEGVVDAVLPLVAPHAASRGITLQRGECVRTAVAEGDRTKVEQVVLNLLSNAIKFTPASGRVTVTCESRGDRVALTVADTGPGVPVDKREAIFEPFVQLGRSLSTGHEGTGLGLAISRDLARGMGGDLALDGPADAGATFTLVLPAAAAAAPARRDEHAR